MATLIKNVRGRILVEFDTGGFDGWCVYLTRPANARYAPSDTEYFARLQQLAAIHGRDKIYGDFVAVYERTTKNIDQNVLAFITSLANGYGENSEEIDIWFTVIYAGMIAEENKANTVLKKRIKRLGMHQALMEQLHAGEAANFSRGKKWRELDAIMRQRGF